MSLLIKGMEMPKNCFECYWRCKVDPENLLCRISGEYFEETFSTIKGRHNSCPLVPVPPHGDLIDKKTVSENLASVLNEKNPPFSYPDWNDAIVAMLTAPTIIPAEEGET